jgi:hypothetical protein
MGNYVLSIKHNKVYVQRNLYAENDNAILNLILVTPCLYYLNVCGVTRTPQHLQTLLPQTLVFSLRQGKHCKKF